MTSAFKYIDDELQNLKQLISFRLDNVLPQEPTTSSNLLSSDTLTGNKPKGEEVNKQPEESKPPFHYADLIVFALRDKSQLTVSEIYDWIIQRFPYFKQVDESRWKPAVRHTLTTNPGFYKAKKANRGFLWAYKSPNQRRLMASQHTHTQTEPTAVSPSKQYNWKKRVCAALEADSITNIPPTTVSTSVQCQPTPVITKQDPIIPILPTLEHCNKTLDIDSNLGSDDEESSGQCTCRVEYFIPKLPSSANLSNSSTCIPCCKGPKVDNVPCCKDSCRPPVGESVSSDWSRVWDQVHGNHDSSSAGGSTYPLRSSSSTQLLLPSRCGKDRITPLSRRCLVLAQAPTVKETKSGHLLCVPVAVPIYRRDAMLKHKDKPASLHEISRSVALAESGLVEESPNLSRIRSVPSTHSIGSSLSHSNMFRLDTPTSPRPTSPR